MRASSSTRTRTRAFPVSTSLTAPPPRPATPHTPPLQDPRRPGGDRRGMLGRGWSLHLRLWLPAFADATENAVEQGHERLGVPGAHALKGELGLPLLSPCHAGVRLVAPPS